MEAIEPEGQAGELGMVVALGRECGRGADACPAATMSPKRLLRSASSALLGATSTRSTRRSPTQRQRVVVAIEAEDLRARLLHGVGHLEERNVIGRDPARPDGLLL